MSTEAKRKRLNLSIDEKRALISLIESKTMKQADICRKYNLSSSTISEMWTNRQKYANSFLMGHIKKARTPKNVDVENALVKWLNDRKSSGSPITMGSLKIKAKSIAQELGYTDFKCSSGWMYRFKNRNITFFPNQKILQQHRDNSIILRDSDFNFNVTPVPYCEDEEKGGESIANNNTVEPIHGPIKSREEKIDQERTAVLCESDLNCIVASDTYDEENEEKNTEVPTISLEGAIHYWDGVKQFIDECPLTDTELDNLMPSIIKLDAFISNLSKREAAHRQ